MADVRTNGGVWVDDNFDIPGRGDDVKELANLIESQLDQIQQQLDTLQWQSLSGNSLRSQYGELSGQDRNTLMRLARQFWLKDPLIHQAVSLTTHYTFGEGLRYSSNNDQVQQVLDDFWYDEDNQLELTSHQAQEQKSTELQVDGEIFFILFEDPSGRVKVRTLPPDEMKEVIPSPDDHRRTLYYERKHRPQYYDFNSKSWRPANIDKFSYYRDWHNYTPYQWGFEGGMGPIEEGVIYHLAVNRMGWQHRGFTELYSVLDWVKAHRGMLQDWVTIVKAYSTLAWKAKIKGDDTRDIDRIRQKLTNIFPQFMPNAGQTFQPAGTAGVAFENDTVALQPMKTAGMATSPSDARQIRLMVGSGTGIMDHYFGDPSTGNLATATAMELPMLKKFEARQRLWENVYEGLMAYAVIKAIDNGKITNLQVEEDTDQEGRIVTRRITKTDDSSESDEINVQAPPILDSDIQAVGQGLSFLVTNGIVPNLEATRYALKSMDIPNIEEIMNKMYPGGINDIPKWEAPPTEQQKLDAQMQMEKDKLASSEKIASQKPPPGAAPPNGGGNKAAVPPPGR